MLLVRLEAEAAGQVLGQAQRNSGLRVKAYGSVSEAMAERDESGGGSGAPAFAETHRYIPRTPDAT